MKTPTFILLVLPVFLFASCQSKKGSSAQSLQFAGQFVIITNGYDHGDITYIVVRNWPESSTPQERRRDVRLENITDKGWIVQESLGHHLTLSDQHELFFFDGDRLTRIPIRMREEDFMGLKADNLKSYSDLLAFFRKYEAGGARQGSSG